MNKTRCHRCWLGVLLMLSPVLAGAKDEPPKEFPSIKPVVTDRIAELEKDLAAKMMRRADSLSTALELQIDLRIIERWLLAQAMAARPQSDLQIAAILRSMELRAAAAHADDALAGAKSVPTRTQSDAMIQVHKISFELAELKSTADLDDLTKRLGYPLLNAVNSTPVDARAIVLMRPKPLESAGTAVESSPSEDPRTLAELSGEVTRAAISVSLRQQLLNLGKAATVAASATPAGTAPPDPALRPDAAALQQMLADGVDLAKGLAGASAFPPDVRARIEAQLSEGLALFSDPRTRSAGRERVNQLTQYRNIMNRLSRLKLSPEVRKALAPGLSSAQVNPEAGQSLLNAIEAYVQVIRRFEAIPRRDNPVANLRHPTEDVVKQIESSKQAFIAAANEPATSHDLLESSLADLSATIDLYGVLDGMQQTYETLNSYKPRPFGAIEQRTLKAALAATATVKSPMRSEAMRYLGDLSKLAQFSNAATARSLSDIPAAVVKMYAGISLNDFELKCRGMMTELVMQVAAGSDMDKKKVARLRSVGDLCDSLRYAALAERALGPTASLSRWVDWNLTPEQARAMLGPYQKNLSAAFSGFITETPDAVEKFLRQREDYLPLIAFLSRDAAYAEPCAALPEGLAGDTARLMAPLDGQPFATERFVGFAMTIGGLLESDDPDAAAIATEFTLQRLKRDMAGAVAELATSIATPPIKPKPK